MSGLETTLLIPRVIVSFSVVLFPHLLLSVLCFVCSLLASRDMSDFTSPETKSCSPPPIRSDALPAEHFFRSLLVEFLGVFIFVAIGQFLPPRGIFHISHLNCP